MNILVVCQYYYPEPFRITDICETLVEEGHNVTVLTGLPNYPEGRIYKEYRSRKRRREIINGVNIIRSYEIPRGKSKFKLFLNYVSYAFFASIKAFFIKERFDVIFVYQTSPVMMAFPALIYKKKKKTKILLYCLDLWPASLSAGGIKEKSVIYKIFLKISRLIYNASDKIFVTSNMFINYFTNVLSIQKKIEYLPQYAEDLFEDISCKDDEMTTKEDKIYNFVFAGNIGRMQSVETIIYAANELRSYKNIKFHIVGDGSRAVECKRLCKELNLSNVIFYGRRPVEEMPKFYAMADAMLVTLSDDKIISYTLPGKVQSYMAAGKPIIGAINGETQDILKKSQAGLYCNAEDYIGLSRIILEFCASENKDEMAVNAKRFYNENFRKENFIIKLQNALKELEESKNV